METKRIMIIGYLMMTMMMIGIASAANQYEPTSYSSKYSANGANTIDLSVDNNTGTYFQSATPAYDCVENPNIIYYNFSESFELETIEAYHSDMTSITWTVQGWNGTAYENISDVVFPTASTWENDTLTTSNNYSEYALFYKAGGCNWLKVHEINFYGNSSTPPATPTSGSGDLIVHLSFDDVSACSYDETEYHTFDAQGTASCINDTEVCKWFGCANLTSTAGTDYFNSTTNFDLNSNVTVTFWVYLETHPTGGSSIGYWEIGGFESTSYAYLEEGDYGICNDWDAEHGEVGTCISDADADGTSAETWTHYAATYDGSNYRVYKDGVLKRTVAQSYGNINDTIGSVIEVGRAIYDIDINGYLDEFKIYNKTLSQAEIVSEYNEQVGGTPPPYDVHILNVSKNSTHLDYTIRSRGLNNITTSFTTTMNVNGTLACTNTASSGLNTGETLTYSCPISSLSENIHTIRIATDTANAITEFNSETNNIVSFPLDLRGFPRFHPPYNATYISAASNNPAKSAYNFYVNFVAEDFSGAWGAGEVDPRGKKGWENAVSCYLSNYNPADSACTRAINHLDGWLLGTITPDDYASASVQSTHEIGSVALTYDLMYNNLTQSQRIDYANALMEVCEALAVSTSVKLYNDNQAALRPDNGQGFGTGLAYPCAVASGISTTNPGALTIPPGTMNLFSTNDAWLNRTKWHLQASQGGRGPEGMLYENYAKYHLLQWIWGWTNAGYLEIDDFAVDGLLIGDMNYLLDFNYEGTSISDEDQNAKFYSFGDTHPYDPMGEINLIGGSLITQYGTITNNQTIKNLALSTRNLLYARDDAHTYQNAVMDIFFYPLLDLSATNQTLEQIHTTLGYGFLDPTWDYLYLRSNRSYTNDDVVIIDGGDKPAWGHPNAEFTLYVYAMGENWLDYGAVPYNDDIRSEWWQNTLSLQDDNASYYWSDGYSAPLNQPYGGAITAWIADYPNANYMPGYSRGNISEAWYNDVGEVFAGGARMYEKYLYNMTGPAERRVIVYDDFILDAFIFNRTPEGYASMSFLNYLELTPGTTNGLDLTYSRGTKKYNISVLYNSTPLSLDGGSTGVIASSEKTVAATLNVTYQRYEYFTNSAGEEIIVFLHHWYDTTPKYYDLITTNDQYGIALSNDINVTLNFGVGDDWYTITGDEEPPVDVTAPVISALSVGSIGISSARLLFTTDESANASVYFESQANSSVNGSVVQTTRTTSHNLLMSGLLSNTTYDYNLSGVCDVSGNCADSITGSFTTLSTSVNPDEGGLQDTLMPLVVVLMLVSFLSFMWIFINEESLTDPKNAVLLIVLTVMVLLGAIIIGSML